MRNINDILEAVVAKIAPVIEIKSVIDNGNGTYDATLCEKFYLQKCFTVNIGGNDYTVEDINGLVATFKGNTPPAPGFFNLYLPYFFYGTITQTNTELTKVEDAADKTPMVYSLETLRERFFDPSESSLEFEAEVRLFFLTQANFPEWETKDFYKDAIGPMKALADLFLDTLEAHEGIGFIEDRDVISLTKFGVEINSKGFETTLVNDHLSGVEVRITIPVFNKNTCSIC